jgi:hypothetical protein
VTLKKRMELLRCSKFVRVENVEEEYYGYENLKFKSIIEYMSCVSAEEVLS